MFPCFQRFSLVAVTVLISSAYPLQLVEAIQGIRATSVQAQTTQDRTNDAEQLYQRGIQQYGQSQFREALETFQQVLTLVRQVGNKAVEGSTLYNIGEVYRNLGAYPKALESYAQALAITRKLGDKTGESKTLNNIGVVYDNLGQYSKAIGFYQQALAIARKKSDKAGEGTILYNLGLVYNNLGQYPKALKVLQQALVIRTEVGDRAGEGATLTGIGLVYNNLGQHPKALQSLQNALAIRTEVGDRVGQGITLTGIGEVYNNLGQYPKALEFYQQALAIHKNVGYEAGATTTAVNIGREFANLGQYADAEKTLLNALEVRESLRTDLSDADKVSIFETQAHTYLFLQKVLVAQNKINTALEIAERGRARAFVELLTSRLSKNSNNPLTIKPPTIQQIQQIAREQKATLVEYSIIGNQVLYIWVIKPTGEIAFKQVDLNFLDTNVAEAAEQANVAAVTGRGITYQDSLVADFVGETRQAIGVMGSYATNTSVAARAKISPRCQTKSCLQQLYQLLIEPIADLLPTNPEDRVIFIPHQSLFLVPFAALQDAAGIYLIEKHTILTAPAIQVLDLTHKRRQQVSGQDVLVVGNPTMPTIGEPPEQLSSLPGAETEAVAIAQLLNTQAIIGHQATKTSLVQQMKTARIIHLATHGLLDDFKGLGVPGAIALAPSGNDNGLLTSSEILELKLNAELVVLSACNTGRGKITGDGVIGLSRSVITAGVPSVIVSLWTVPDEPTASLMTQFYQKLQQNPDKAQALRQAMLTTLKQYPDPINWAAFTLIGEAH
jgi:CHAT domain-containing protein/Flp pilus assembly protein TadD